MKPRIWFFFAAPCLLQPLAAAEVAPTKVILELAQADSSVPQPVLPQGTVFLQRLDDPSTLRTAPLNTETELPPGEWMWPAEAPGWVSVGWNVVPATAVAMSHQVIRAKAVPSCLLELTKEPRSTAFRRLWVVAVEESTIYRHILPRPLPLAVPQGTFFLAGFGQSALLGLSGPHRCRDGGPLHLSWPAPPNAESHAFLAELVLPTGEAIPRLEELVTTIQPPALRARLGLVRPAATVWTGPRGVTVFPAVPAGREMEWSVFHPKLRTLLKLLEPAGGGGTALEAVQLRRRTSLKIPIDYQPARPHRKQKVLALYCGRNDSSEELYIQQNVCTPLGQEHRLRPGMHEYSFADLDHGQYVFNAEVDEETVYGLGKWFTPFLSTEADAFEEPETQLLKELHLWGHLLQDGAAVPGEVRLGFLMYNNQLLRFPTDDELFYQAYYFGYYPLRDSWVTNLPESAHSLPREELRGIQIGWVLHTCTAEGACRIYRQGSTIAGGGRQDFNLGPAAEIALEVTDAETGKPIPEASVLYGGQNSGPTSHFFSR